MHGHITKPSLWPWFVLPVVLVWTFVLPFLPFIRSGPVDARMILRSGACALFLLIGIYGYQMLRFNWQVRNLAYRVCRKCLYNLTGLPDDGLCPECSRPYSLQSLAKDWGVWRVGTRSKDPS